MPIAIITGPPGAGKTTVASALARCSMLSVHLVADTCFHWITSGSVAPWLPHADRQNATVIAAVGAAAGRFADGGYEVVVHGIVGPWFLDVLCEALGGTTEPVHYVVLRPSRDIARRRAVARPGRRDLVAPGPVGTMYDAFADLGPFENHVIDSSVHALAETVEMVAQGIDRGQFALTDGAGPSRRH